MNKIESLNELKKLGWIDKNIDLFPLLMSKNKMILKWNTKVSGIYIWINKINNKMYVGKANNFYRRIYGEKRSFSNGRHENLKKLFNSVNKHGIKNFEVRELITTPNKDHLFKLECLFISYFDTKNNGYNCTLGGEGCLGHIVTEKQKEKQKQKMKEYWTDEKKNEHKEKMRIWYENKSDVEKQKMKDDGASWIKNPIFLKKFQENYKKSITQDRILRQSNSLKEHYKTHIHKKSIQLKIKSPTGEIINVNGSSNFCLNNHMGYKSFKKLLNGEIKEFKGWKIIKE